MEKTDLDEGQEIFQECNSTDITKTECKESLSDLNLPPIENEQQNEELYDFANYKQNNNNHHIVPVGLIIVFVTIYLGMTSVQKCLVSCVENPEITEQVTQRKEDFLNYLQKSENLENSQILERLLEYKDICKDLEVFTKDIEKNELDGEVDNNDVILKVIEVSGSGAAAGGVEEEEQEEGSSVEMVESSSGASGNGDCYKVSRIKHKKSKYSIKTTNSKNGFNKYNKSTKAKYQNKQKKELNLNKKNSTAEPIIYLFALVFIYLLLKAASDINQHYKSQNKNDKRLRRCSLQSYAQTHRPDRRASKGISAKSLPKF